MEEEFTDIPGFEGRYCITRSGVIKSYPRTHYNYLTGGTRTIRAKVLKQWVEKGYKRVALYNGFKDKTYMYVHRLVLSTFVGPKKGKQINHIDGNPLNNDISNLEWCTAAENISHSITVLKRQGGYRKPVFDSDTGITYDTAKEAYEAINPDMDINCFRIVVRLGNTNLKYV